MDFPEPPAEGDPESPLRPTPEFLASQHKKPENSGLSPAVLAVAGLMVFLAAAAVLFFTLGSTSTENADISDTGDSSESADGAAASDDGRIRSERDNTEDADSAKPGEGPQRVEATTQDHLACPEDVLTELCGLAAFVETARGRPFKEFPTIELQEDEEFYAGLLVDFDESLEELEIQGQVLRSLGLIGPDDDLAELYRSTLEIGVVGYYDTEVGGLVVRGSEFDLYSKLVLVHELTHAHDDQWLTLDRPELEDSEGEIDFGFLAIQEGNASRVENEWRDLLSAQDQEELDALEGSVISPEDIDRYLAIPIFLLQMQISPYVDGLTLVEAIAEAGGEDAVDAAFDSPPASSEQVLHPDQYLSGEDTYLLPEPSVPGTVIDSGVFGELGFLYWFGLDASEGWKADSYATWLEGDVACTRIDVETDTDLDLDELSDAARDWASEAGGREVESADGVLSIIGCA